MIWLWPIYLTYNIIILIKTYFNDYNNIIIILIATAVNFTKFAIILIVDTGII